MKKIQRVNRFVFRAQNESGEIIPLIGYQITVSNNEKYYDMQNLKTAFKSCELPENYIGEVTKEGMITRTINETVKQLRDSNFTFKKVGDETSNSVVYKIYKQEVSRNNGKLDGEMKPYAHITYHKHNETITTDNQEIELMLSRNYKIFLTNFINADVSRYIRTMLERESTVISLRKSGGVYIIPAKDHVLIEKVQKLFNLIDPNGDCNVVEIPDMQGAKTSVAKGFQRGVADVCKEIQERLQKMKEAGDDMSKTIRKNLFSEIVELQKELELMRDITEYDLQESADIMQSVNDEIANYSAV